MSFLAAQSTSTTVGRNIQEHARACYIAESALTMTISYVQSDENWRSERSEGMWVRDAAFEGGKFTVKVYDGYDQDGDGQIDGDGDLGDDAADPFTIKGRVRSAAWCIVWRR